MYNIIKNSRATYLGEVGVLFLIFIVIIIAVVLGSHVILLDNNFNLEENSPDSNIEIHHTTASNHIYINHIGGDEIDKDNIEILISGDEATYITEMNNNFKPDDEVVVQGSSSDSVEVIWTSDDGEITETLVMERGTYG